MSLNKRRKEREKEREGLPQPEVFINKYVYSHIGTCVCKVPSKRYKYLILLQRWNSTSYAEFSDSLMVSHFFEKKE